MSYRYVSNIYPIQAVSAIFFALSLTPACSSSSPPSTIESESPINCDTGGAGFCTEESQTAIEESRAAPEYGRPSEQTGNPGLGDGGATIPGQPTSKQSGSVIKDGGAAINNDGSVVGPGSVVAEPEDEASHIFDQAVVHTFDVEITLENLEIVDSNPAAEQYVPARLSFEGKTYDIGFRYKGSMGAFFPPCTDLLSGGRKAGKCSVKVSFNWSDSKGMLLGLKKLVFNSMNNDPSMMRERLGYSLFREMDAPAPRATHAVLRINGQADIFTLVEVVDGRFTRSHFTEGGKGNLYKEIWPVWDDPQAYLSALRTNEDDNPSVDRILRFSQAIFQGPNETAAWMDADATTSWIAVDRVIMNDDGPFHLYCFPGALGSNPAAPGNHNYYWYEAKDADRLWIIPWDLDLSMGGTMTGTLTQTLVAVDWRTQFAADAEECKICEQWGVWSSLGPPPGCDRLFQAFQAWQAQYEAKVDRLVAGPFSKAAVDNKINKWKQQISGAGFPVNETAISELTRILDQARINRGYAY
ncbi:MAG: CotH kinase family protein [Deltaproteobacteria bacterium]|nr:CotH kinase family protein [Deltaproteobacteria bacterium]